MREVHFAALSLVFRQRLFTVQFDDDANDTETFLLGSREISATTDLTVYSPESAMGTAILGHKPGDAVSYETPHGATINVSVVKLEPFTG